MKVSATSLEGVVVIEPRVFGDQRGYFLETYHGQKYAAIGVDTTWVQDNLSYSKHGTLRGLHFQIRFPQAKLVQVLTGEIYDVVVDIRRGSSTFGKWTGIHLTAANHHQLYVPKGFAHGFCVLSDAALFHYKCSEFYHPEDEGGIIWSDPDIGITWPVTEPLVSPKDAALPRLAELAADRLPQNGHQG